MENHDQNQGLFFTDEMHQIIFPFQPTIGEDKRRDNCRSTNKPSNKYLGIKNIIKKDYLGSKRYSG